MLQAMLYAILTLVALVAAYWLYTKRTKAAMHTMLAVIAGFLAIYCLFKSLYAAVHSPLCWLLAVGVGAFFLWRRWDKRAVKEEAVKP